jgi:hypothetical protein
MSSPSIADSLMPVSMEVPEFLYTRCEELNDIRRSILRLNSGFFSRIKRSQHQLTFLMQKLVPHRILQSELMTREIKKWRDIMDKLFQMWLDREEAKRIVIENEVDEHDLAEEAAFTRRIDEDFELFMRMRHNIVRSEW